MAASSKAAIKVLQAVTGLHSNLERVDGVVGNNTRKAVAALGSSQRKMLEKTMSDLGLPNPDVLLAPVTKGTFPVDFQVVAKAVTAEARRRGVNPTFYLAQIAHETGWGRSVPRLPNRQSSNNFAGLKYESVKSQVKGKTDVSTLEYIKGLPETIRDGFAVFSSAEEFARVYFWYLFEGPSSYRYPGLKDATTARQFGEILQKGGYATDPSYGVKLAAVHQGVVSRFGDNPTLA